MIKFLNLFSGFAFVIFGYSALNMIPEFKNYLGQELVGWWIFYSTMFCLTFIAWALSYQIISNEKTTTLTPCERRLLKERNKQMEFELWQND